MTDSNVHVELRVQRLESMYETAREALLDAYRQIDDLKRRVDRHYIKIRNLEEIIEDANL